MRLGCGTIHLTVTLLTHRRNDMDQWPEDSWSPEDFNEEDDLEFLDEDDDDYDDWDDYSEDWDYYPEDDDYPW